MSLLKEQERKREIHTNILVLNQNYGPSSFKLGCVVVFLIVLSTLYCCFYSFSFSLSVYLCRQISCVFVCVCMCVVMVVMVVVMVVVVVCVDVCMLVHSFVIFYSVQVMIHIKNRILFEYTFLCIC